MIDLQNETIQSLADGAAYIGRLTGRTPHAATVWRWADKGVAGIKLEVARVGGRKYTSAEAIQRFVDRCTEADGDATPARRTTRQRERAINAAEKRLALVGI